MQEDFTGLEGRSAPVAPEAGEERGKRRRGGRRRGVMRERATNKDLETGIPCVDSFN